MRWSGQQVLDDGVGPDSALPGLRGLLRSVRTPEFAGTVFHEVEAKSALNKVPSSSPVPFRWTVNPYRGCAHACVYCLAGPTRVLLTDGRTRPISELRVGDAVMGTEGIGSRRRYVRTTVLAHWSTVRPAHAVRLAGGAEIVASGEHRFLTERGWRHVGPGWCRSGRRPRLRSGSVLVGPGGGRDGARSRPHTAAYRQGYLCGLVRGDGPVPAAATPTDLGFPSERLELEALGRAHHFLAEVPRSTVPGSAVPGSAVSRSAGAWSTAGVVAAAVGREPGRVPPPVARSADGGSVHGIGSITDAVRWPEHPGHDWCAGFVAGMIDSAGSVEHGELRIGAVGTDPVVGEELVGRIVGALHRLGFRFVVDAARASSPPSAPVWWSGSGDPSAGRDPDDPGRGISRTGARSVRVLGGPAELLRLLGVVDPAVSRLRDIGGGAVTGTTELEVTSVRALGVEMVMVMYDITTGTGDFVADGVISHNCFARGTHTYLDLDAGADFDSQIVVKVNIARVLERELRAARWAREPVAMGTNTDPYQRAEGRYRLMPGVIRALARSGTPFSLLTKGTVLSRDLPDIVSAATEVPVGLGVSVALTDRDLASRLEPGTPSPQARLDLVRRITDAGLPCGVTVAPVLPLLTDSTDGLDHLLGRISSAGATGASVLALHLRPGTREWFLAWLAREHPRLVDAYARLYRRGAYVDPEYRRALGERVAPLLRRHGLTGGTATLRGRAAAVRGTGRSAGGSPTGAPGAGEQMSLL